MTRFRGLDRPLLLRTAALVVVALLAAAPSGLAAEQGPQRLFASVAPTAGSMASVAAVAESAVALDLGALDAERLMLELPDGLVLEASRTRLERRGAGDLTWLGRSAAGGDVILTLKNGYVSGLIYGLDTVYQVIPQADGGHRVVRLDQSLFPECAGGIEPPPTKVAQTPQPAPQTKADPLDRVEVMVLYTPQALSGAGGVAQVETIAQNAVDITNLAYANSQITVRMYLVHTAQATRNDSGSMSGDLSWLRNDAGVAALRNTHAADMVALLVNGGGACGVGYVQRNPGPGFESSAFQVTALGCAVGNLSFAHEFGHNMGCEHNPENSDAWPSSGSFAWSYGHWHSGNYRTVMSYSNPCAGGCTRHPYFSNSSITFQGQPTGVLDSRENYRTINGTAQFVTNFRESGRFFSDGFESGDTSGWGGVE